MKAITKDGTILKEGDVITAFNGGRYTFINVTRHNKIYCMPYPRFPDSFARELNPSVFNLRLEDEND